jgi:hypothetical protein
MKRPLAVSLALFLLICCILWTDCGTDKSSGPDEDVSNTDFVAKESFSYGEEVTDHTKLRLDGINGNVSVTGLSEADSVIITGERRVGSESMQDAEAHLQELEVSVIEVADEVYVKTTQPTQAHGRSYVVDYNINLPKDLRVLVTNVNGGVAIDSINSSLYVVNVNGQVTLNQIFCNTQVSLVNGQIQAKMTLPTNGVIVMSTVNGGINLNIPQSTSAEFSASVATGTISISHLILMNLVSTPNSLTGTLGDGQGVISFSTTNGNISVSGF